MGSSGNSFEADGGVNHVLQVVGVGKKNAGREMQDGEASPPVSNEDF